MDKNLIALIKILIKKSYITRTDLEVETNCSKRQITYRLEKINDLVEAKKLPPIEYGNQKEIIIKTETKNFLIEILRKSYNDKFYYFDKRERIIYLYIMLFMNLEYLSLQHFMSSLKVSRSTILNDLKDLEQELAKENIKISNNRSKGYYISGPELDIRGYMMKLVLLSLEDDHNSVVFNSIIDDYHLESFQFSKKTITELANKYKIHFVGDRLDEFIYIFIFLKARLKNHKNLTEEYLGKPNLDIISEMKEYKFTGELLSYYKDTTSFSEQEFHYITAWILAVSVGNFAEETEDKPIISEIVDRIMIRFEVLSGTHYNEGPEIFKQLYSHIRPAYYRLLFRLPIYNPLYPKIKEEYSELFLLVKETMKPLEGLFDGEIPEEEIAYLTMHFASIYSKKRDYEEVVKKNALVVCSNGIGLSAILYNELKDMFTDLNFYLPIDAVKFKDFDKPVDIIFTTEYQLHLIESNIPIIKINPIINPRERYEIIRQVYTLLDLSVFKQPSLESIMEIIWKYATISNPTQLYSELLSFFSSSFKLKNEKKEKGYRLIDLISEDCMNLGIDAKDWEEAIRISGNSLVRKNKVTQDYVEKVVENLSPYFVITPLVALPHTRPEFGALSYSIGITVLNRPVEFGNNEKPVKYIFFLSSLDNKKHLPAMSDLLHLLNQKSFFEMLDGTKDKKAVLEYIRCYTSQSTISSSTME